MPLQEQGQTLQRGPGVLMLLSTWKCPDGWRQEEGDKMYASAHACSDGKVSVPPWQLLFMELRDKTGL